MFKYKTDDAEAARSQSVGKFDEVCKDFGVTHEGRKFLLHALDPVSEQRAAIPDAKSKINVLGHVQPVLTITAADATDRDPDGLWDLAIVSSAGDNTLCYWAAAKSGTNFNTLSNTGGVVELQPPELATVTLTSIPGASGTTSGQLRVPVNRYTAFRASAQSITAYYTGPTIDDGGSVVVARFDQVLGAPSFLARLNDEIWRMSTREISLDETDFDEMAVKVFRGRAKDGFYAPIPGVVNDYVPRVSAFMEGVPWDDVDGNAYRATITTDTYAAIKPYFVGPVDENTLHPVAIPWLMRFPPTDLGIDGRSNIVAIFRGLGPNASIMLKNCSTVEGLVAPNSPLRKFTRLPEPFDPRAIELYTRLLDHPDFKVAYQARWNFFGFLPGLLAAIGSSLWAVAKPVIATAATAAISAGASSAVSAISKAATPKAKPKKKVELIVETTKAPKSRPKAKRSTAKPRVVIRG